MAGHSCLTLVGVSRRFGRNTVLKNISLQVACGEVYGLVGPNGAGKSTLLALACGLLRPTAGSITIMGLPVLHQQTRIGVAFQEPALYPYLSGWTNLEVLGVEPQRVLPLQELFGLDENTLRQRVTKLSVGQRQRLALLLTLAKPAMLYLLDEPFAELDAPAVAGLGTAIQDRAKWGAAVVITSHDWPVLAALCHRIGVLVNGMLKEELVHPRRGTMRIHLCTSPDIQEGQLASCQLVLDVQQIGPGDWELTLPSAIVASDALQWLLSQGIPVVSWQPLDVAYSWQQAYHDIIRRTEVSDDPTCLA